jgi:uncharacterized protein (DUF488 family)
LVNASDLDPAQDYVFTIGHSNISFEDLLENLQAYGVEALADVRSQPVSKYTPHFNRNELLWRLQEAGIRYAFMGDQLGGRPAGTEFYDEEGYVRYDLWSASETFQDGIAKLEHAAARRRVAVLCSEENPAECHRHLLIARVLEGRCWASSRIIHIRSDGSCLPDDAIPVQQDLFGGTVGWRSPQSVLHKVQRSTSSNASRELESADSWTSG